MTRAPNSSVSRVVIVAGATRGIGRATADRLARNGWAVVVNYAHDQRSAESTVDEILGLGGMAEAIRADVTDELDVERLFSEAIESCGGVDAVVHAVIGSPTASRTLAEVGIEEFRELIRSGAVAGFLVNREAARRVRDGGAIVNLTSVAVSQPRPQASAEAAGRAAVDVLTCTAAQELAARGITVNAVALDLRSSCEPEHLAEVIEYLLSDSARDVTGQVIRTDQADWTRDARRDGDTSLPQR